MTGLVVLASLIAYLATGAIYARANAVRYYQRLVDNGRRRHPILFEDGPGDVGYRYVDTELRFLMAMTTMLWPGRMIYDFLVVPAGRWFTAPIDRRRVDVDQARADATRWRELAGTGNPAEQQMAAELARMCDERADQLDLWRRR